MEKGQLIQKIFERSENPVQSVEDLANLCPFLFATPAAREKFNGALRKHGYEINESFFQESDQITMMAHPSCGSSSDYGSGHPSCGSSRDYGWGHPSCGCSFSSKRAYSKILLPINKEVGKQIGIRN